VDLDVDEVVFEWVVDHRSSLIACRPDALRALIAVREGGELRALWDETDDAEEWRTRLMDLEVRLN
jgi:hypothetical protein